MHKKNLGRIAILATTLLWGSSFVVMKDTLGSITPLYILAFRFSGAVPFLFLVGMKDLKRLDGEYVTGGALMGLFVFLGYVLQTYGLKMTTPGKNAFLTATYCVMVPFLYWLIDKRKPDKYNIIAGIICLVGMGFITLQGNFTVGAGDVLTMACGLFFGLHIITASRYVGGRNPALLTMIQFIVAGALAWIFAVAFEPFPVEIPRKAAFSLIYLTVVATGMCFLLQVFGQKYTPPSQTAIIMSLESVFGAGISILFFDETLTVSLFIGFLLVFAAVLVSETKLGFIRTRRQDKKIL